MAFKKARASSCAFGFGFRLGVVDIAWVVMVIRITCEGLVGGIDYAQRGLSTGGVDNCNLISSLGWRVLKTEQKPNESANFRCVVK